MPEVEILYDVKNRSGTVGNSAYVRFINKTEKVVEIVWLNHTGKYIRYRILKKDYFVDVNTYNAHLWVAFDHETKDRLHIDKEFVYHPKTSKEFFKQKYPDRVIPEHYEARIRAFITLPLYSLRYNSLLTIRNLLKTSEDADKLELPTQLIEDLKKVIVLRNNLAYTLNSQETD
ncbi:unnamed protein product [Psylliodes chrysocephalus]|uniref:von Hippel-Lindau disease tumour suppressor beta domain-containing protein n=1 Tax=Psylliodes chrysocephalus TaxID=3402493 RepID=A0A9P0CYU2_9CUCU|nr:unnamed protein product [Psylliodes chrysocephala]